MNSLNVTGRIRAASGDPGITEDTGTGVSSSSSSNNPWGIEQLLPYIPAEYTIIRSVVCGVIGQTNLKK
jgi:hypothetical protein